MNISRIILIILSAAFFVMGQPPTLIHDGIMTGRPASPGKQVSAAEFRMLTVEYILNSGSPLKIGSVQLHRMGDEVAVNLVKLMAKDGGLNRDQTATALDMLEKAFEQPKAIISRVDTSPLATISLLRDLALSEKDPATKGRIQNLLQRFEPMLK